MQLPDYDLTFEPPTAKARAPSWTQTGVELPRDAAQSTLALGTVHLPDAAYVRGYVYDDEGAGVEGAEVRLYRVQSDQALCEETRFEPQGCPIPPLLLGHATSDKDGGAADAPPLSPRGARRDRRALARILLDRTCDPD